MPVPVINVAQMREWEKASWSAGCLESEVIQQVGGAVARRALELTLPGDSILLLAGKGNNGADVRQAQARLSHRSLTVIDARQPEIALSALQGALAHRPRLIVDGLFGIGLNRPLEGGWAELVETVNAARVPVLAVDVPSGLNADTGEVLGRAIEATVTVTVGAPKVGLLKMSAVKHVGRLEVAAQVGLVPCPARSELWWTLAGDFRGFPPPRLVSGHKGAYGHVTLLAGSMGYHGAAVMAARGAARAMPGLVSLLVPENVYAPVAAQLSAAMVHPLRRNHPLLESTDALMVGPGLASADLPPDLAPRIRQLWLDSPKPMVVDASALAWLPVGPVGSSAARVMTPHPGEAARLLGTTAAQVQADRPKALRELSARFGDCWVILKGHQTLIGRSRGDVFVNSSGNPGLGQGGTGDVLAGYLAGYLAHPGYATEESIRYAVWQHGAAADLLAARHQVWTVDDLLVVLGNAEAK